MNSLNSGPRRERGRLYAFPQQTLYSVGIASVALGIARGMLDAFIELALRKTPRGTGRLADNAVIQAEVARAEARLGAARCYRRARPQSGQLGRGRGDLAHHRAHAPANEPQLHGAHVDSPPVQLSRRRDDGVTKLRGFLRGSQALFVLPGIDEFQRIGGYKVLIELLKFAIVEKRGQASARVDAFVMLAFRTNLQVVLESLTPDNLAAMFALEPQSLRTNAPLAFFRLHGRFVSSEPCHQISVWHSSPAVKTAPPENHTWAGRGLREEISTL